MLSITNMFMFKWAQSSQPQLWWPVSENKNPNNAAGIRVTSSQTNATRVLYTVWQSGYDCSTLSMTTRETATALTTIHRHNRRASHKILKWWSWYKGGTKRRQNLCALVAEFGRIKSNVQAWVIFNVKGRTSPSSLLLTNLLLRTARGWVTLWKRRLSHKT